MTKQAVAQGVFAELKSVKTRSVVQMVIEIPIERAAEIVEAFGFPQPGSEVHVAVARLTNDNAKAEEAKERRRLHDMPVGQQAALACQNAIFRAFVRENFDPNVRDADHVAEWMRRRFHVRSRREISHTAWASLWAQFQAWNAAERAA